MDQKNLDILKRGMLDKGVDGIDEKAALLARFYELVIDANSRFNLTAILSEEDFVVKHFLDSLSALSLIPKGARLLDIGAGAGFPSVPIAIARPDVTVVALDATQKKARFIEESAAALGVTNLFAEVGRAEERKDLFCKFDVATARAVAPLNILLEFAAPTLKTGGIFVAYKADDSEVKSAQNAILALKMQHEKSIRFALSNGDSRALIVCKKLAATPEKYPRRYGAIKKAPL